MACCGKGKSSGENGIPFEMKELKVEKFDELFSKASETLSSAEDLRAGVTDMKAMCMAISGAYQLKTGNMGDAFSCVLWSIGGEVGADKLAGFTPKIGITSDPIFEMPELGDQCSAENKDFMEAFKVWCETVSSAPEAIKTLTEGLQSISSQASELAGTAKDECSNAGLNPMDTMKAIASLASNTKTLATGISKLGQLAPLAAEALTDMKDIIAKLPEMMKDGVKNTNEGKEKGAKTAVEFCEKQHAGEKMPEAEAKNSDLLTTYNKNKAAGKKLPTVKKAGAPAAEGAAEGAAEAKPEDVKPEVKDV